MDASFNFVAIILLLGLTQGLFLTLLLFSKPVNKKANRLLALLIFSYSVFLVETSIQGMQVARDFPHILGLSSGIVFLLGPLHYLYARSLISSNAPSFKKDLFHLIPFVVFYLYFLFPYYLRSGAYKIAFFQMLEKTGPTPALSFFSWVVLFQGIIYMWLTFNLLKQHSVNIREEFSSVEQINLDWLKRITVITMIIYLVGIVIELIQTFDPTTPFQGLVPIAIAILIYIMGYLGLRQPEIFSGVTKVETKELKKYERSGLTKQKSRQIHQRLTDLMNTKKVYIDSTLKLSQLAGMVSTSPNYLSQVINEERQQNFYDFVNWYRIEEAKRLIADPAHQQETLLSIAYSVGFNSKSAFNTAFKKNTGMPPTQFKKDLKQ